MHVLFFLVASTIPLHLFAPEDYRKDGNVKDKLCIHYVCVFVSHTQPATHTHLHPHKYTYMYKK